MIDKYTLLDPVQVSDWVTQFHAPVVFYQTPKCRQGVPERPQFVDYGMTVGCWKYIGGCAPSPRAGRRRLLLPDHARRRDHVGVRRRRAQQRTRGRELQLREDRRRARLVASGADYLLAPHPGKAEKWLK